MSGFDQLTQGMSDAERLTGLLGITVLLCLLTWMFIRWLLRGDTRPDPWGDDVATELAADNATPICHHCLTAHEHSAHFCPQCGAAVGTYTTLLPLHYVYAMGHGLRIGTTEKFNRTPLTVIGFFLFGFWEYSLFAPFYWFKLLRNLRNADFPAPPASAAPGEGSAGGEPV